jgi:hypothetical protein
MQECTDRFLGLSAALTGFGRVELLGTGMVDEYLRTLDAILPAGLLDELLAVFERLPQDAALEAAITSQVMNDPKLGPVARNLVLLWYCGTWTVLPDAWRAAYGASPLDTTHVVSADAYQSGLQWSAAGAHPAGAQQQGFGAWSLAPERKRSGS